MDILFNHINYMDDHITFTMECPDNEGKYSLSWTQNALQTLITLYTPLCIENPHIVTDIWTGIPTTEYLQKAHSSTHPQGQDSMLSPLICSAKEMDYLNKVLHRNSYPDWFLKEKQTIGLIWTKSPTRKPPRNPLYTVSFTSMELNE